jgi:hypothetical protein
MTIIKDRSKDHIRGWVGWVQHVRGVPRTLGGEPYGCMSVEGGRNIAVIARVVRGGGCRLQRRAPPHFMGTLLCDRPHVTCKTCYFPTPFA